MSIISQLLKLADQIDDKNINVDQLITKPQLFTYVNPDSVDGLLKDGFHLKKDELLVAYPSRIPENVLPNSYLQGKVPIKISILKLDKSSDKYSIFLIYKGQRERLTKDQIKTFCDKPELFQNFVKKIGLKDTPKIGIQCMDDFDIPPFALKSVE